MRRISITLMIVTALAVGGVARFFFASHRYGRTAKDIISAYEFGQAADTLDALRNLRAGNTNAVFDALENDLDSSIITVRGILNDYPTIENAKDYTNLLFRIVGYRSKYPYHSDITNMDASVSEILAVAKKEK